MYTRARPLTDHLGIILMFDCACLLQIEKDKNKKKTNKDDSNIHKMIKQKMFIL